jgi:hypothetical protein
VLARVGGDPVTRAELDFALQRVAQGRSVERIPERAKVEQRLLESLLDARAMAGLAWDAMTPAERESLGLQVRAYREELLVQRWLSAHTTPEPVSSEMVERYYRQHPRELGGGRELGFELVRSAHAPSEAERDRLIGLLAGLERVDDWQAWVGSDAGLGFEYSRTQAEPTLLEQPLRGLVEGTPVGAVSAIGQGPELLRVRVLSEREIPPRSLEDSSAEIRRRLAPMQLREGVKRAAAEAREGVAVTYPPRPAQP